MQGDTVGDGGDGPQRLALLASALAGRTVAVASGAPGEPAWTDGVTVFIDAEASAARQIESVTVQASLMASGSLAPDVMRQLLRRPALARRYLAVEGQRALSANDDLLPYPVRRLIDLDVASRANSPADSLKVAADRDIADPPASFGGDPGAQPALDTCGGATRGIAGHPLSAARREEGTRRPRRGRRAATGRTWRIRSPARSAAAGQSENCCNACCAGCVSSAAAGRREPIRRHIDHPTAFEARELSRRRRRRLPRSTTSMTATAGSTRNGISSAGATGMTGARSTSPIRPASRDIHSNDPMCMPCGDH